MAEGYDVKYGGQSIEGNYVLQPTAGATGTKTAIAAADSDDGVAHILAGTAPSSLGLNGRFNLTFRQYEAVDLPIAQR